MLLTLKEPVTTATAADHSLIYIYIFFLFFFRKISLDNSCELSAKSIHMRASLRKQFSPRLKMEQFAVHCCSSPNLQACQIDLLQIFFFFFFFFLVRIKAL